MMGAFAEYERAMIVKKLRGARQRARATRKDYREGRKPYGWRPGEEGTIRKILKILEMRSAGMACDTIAKTLNTAGIAARKGCWHPTSVSRVVKANQ